jgi:hypothetical protein
VLVAVLVAGRVGEIRLGTTSVFCCLHPIITKITIDRNIHKKKADFKKEKDDEVKDFFNMCGFLRVPLGYLMNF